ncbi:hypothetical protein GQ55_9G632400 [Panicum hallii var. hallii]|uniref:Uncharacterized protein n=1 Tax=Panicum hallii var. hallii TaxID=1504633 RepID=A0A2T7CI94_9POAL|nr:hypothetical protein GQ55_9G632400 [Panicum hallii var. hallii]
MAASARQTGRWPRWSPCRPHAVTAVRRAAIMRPPRPRADPEHGRRRAPRDHRAASSLPCATAFTISAAPRPSAPPLPTGRAVAEGIGRNRPAATLPATTRASGGQLRQRHRWRL